MYVPISDCFLISAQSGKPRVLMLPLSVVADVAFVPPQWHRVSLASLSTHLQVFLFLLAVSDLAPSGPCSFTDNSSGWWPVCHQIVYLTREPRKAPYMYINHREL